MSFETVLVFDQEKHRISVLFVYINLWDSGLGECFRDNVSSQNQESYNGQSWSRVMTVMNEEPNRVVLFMAVTFLGFRLCNPQSLLLQRHLAARPTRSGFEQRWLRYQPNMAGDAIWCYGLCTGKVCLLCYGSIHQVLVLFFPKVWCTPESQIRSNTVSHCLFVLQNTQVATVLSLKWNGHRRFWWIQDP